MAERIFVTGLGEDSHRFASHKKALVLGGYTCSDQGGLEANSDGDVILHALCNAISSLTGRLVLGPRADELCQQGKIHSRAYLALALEDLERDKRDWLIHQVAISLEGAQPKILPLREKIRDSLAALLGLERRAIGLTATSGEGLTSFGQGLGLRCTVLVSASYRQDLAQNS